MKLNIKLLLAATLLATTGTVLVGSTGASASSLKGEACPAAGSVLSVGNTTYTCVAVKVTVKVKVGKKIVTKTVTKDEWNAGVTVQTITLPTTNFDTTPPGTLLWQEAFNESGPLFSQNYNNGTALTSTPVTKYWTAVTGSGTYGTGEIENNVASAATEDGYGNLIITATCIAQSNPGCESTAQPMGQTWTAARIWTQGKLTFEYGDLEARIWLPAGAWNWPAFWMMGQDFTNPAVGWPNCGEIDIAEGLQHETIDGATIHSNNPGTSADWEGGSGLNQQAPISTAAMTGGYHTYGVLWVKNAISFTLDGKVFAQDSYNPANGDVTQTIAGESKSNVFGYSNGAIPGVGGSWPFNQPFFIIFNDAIGGITSPVAQNGTTSQMKISWVKYYKYQGQGTVTGA